MFDLTEEVTHHFVAGGLVVHNCSEYLFLDDTACNLASINLVKFLREDGSIDVDGFRHACRLWTSVLEISVLMAAYPSPAIAQRSWDFRTLGLGYANMGTVLMRRGIPYDSPEGHRHLRRADRDHVRRGLRDLGRDGAGPRAVPRLPEEPRPHAARDAQPPAGRLRRRRRGVRGPQHHAARHRSRALPAPAAHGRARDVGPGGRARRAVRLPQRPGHGPGPDRHHRPRDGLRHHRHRARLLAREVQEARGRRLLQDHQPEPAPGPGDARLHPGRDRRHRGLLHRPQDAPRRAVHQPRHAPGQGLRRGGAAAAGSRDRDRVRHHLRLQRLDPRRGLRGLAARHQRGAARRVERQPAARAGLRPRRDRGGQRLLLRHHDRRGRARC